MSIGPRLPSLPSAKEAVETVKKLAGGNEVAKASADPSDSITNVVVGTTEVIGNGESLVEDQATDFMEKLTPERKSLFEAQRAGEGFAGAEQHEDGEGFERTRRVGAFVSGAVTRGVKELVAEGEAGVGFESDYADEAEVAATTRIGAFVAGEAALGLHKRLAGSAMVGVERVETVEAAEGGTEEAKEGLHLVEEAFTTRDFLGVRADGEAEVSRDALGLGAETFAGAKTGVEEQVSANFGGVPLGHVGVGGHAAAGFGGDIGAKVTNRDGELTVGGHIGSAFIVGAGVEGEVGIALDIDKID